ncbi:MAG: hydroxymethylbilane synthase [Gammaproteobacteria bacterium]|nr:hydroxymethylbilane synthase [Gammaproteobacteria bacterium]
MHKIRIATRESALALWQAEYVKELLRSHFPDLQVEIVGITTRGDKILDKPLSKVGGKGLFVKELETALFEGTADIAVHSMKDVPMQLPDGMSIATICERADPRDAFVSNDYQNLEALPSGAKLGTSSVRRKSQISALRPDLDYVDLRGNVGTRLRKLDEGNYAAILLAVAGLERLELSDRITYKFPVETSIPAAGQGAVGIECRSDDQETLSMLQLLNHEPTFMCVSAERAMSRSLNANCEAPVAAYAQLIGKNLNLVGLVARLDGSQIMIDKMAGDASQAEQLGIQLADKLIAQGALELLGI